MSENVTLDRIEFEKLKQQAKATRAAQLSSEAMAWAGISPSMEATRPDW